MRIGYIGIDFLDSALKALLDLPDCEILKIFVCKTDNKTEFNTEVISLAERNGIPWTDQRIREDDMVWLKERGCEAVICAGYYHKVPISGLLPVVNVHPSYLPVGRGAWPMPVTILKKLPTSGVTLHRMTAAMDEGNILLQESFPVAEDENLKTISEKIAVSVDRLIRELMTDFHGYYERAIPQPEGEYWANPTEADWTITADMEADKIDRILRAFYGYECIWREGDARFELIDAVLLPPGQKPTSVQRAFRTSSGRYVCAPRVARLTEKIDCSHEERVERLRALAGSESSAWAFPSLYLWQNAMGLSIAFDQDCCAVKCASRGDNTWFFPLGTENACRAFLNERMQEENFTLIYVEEHQTELLQSWFPNRFSYTMTPDDSEYIYDIDAHLRLKGKAYANVRSQWNRAVREHTVSLIPLTESNRAQAENILQKWHSDSQRAAVSADAEHIILHSAEALHMELYLSLLDGEACGIIGGFPLNGSIFDICIAKEDRRIPGISYAFKRLLFEKLAGRYEYANIEEDLGVAGLRFMKRSLVPIRMNTMWLVNQIS